MFLRSTNRKKDGKDDRYFSVVENRRVSAGMTVQRTVVYLGEINDTQQTAWLKTLDVFDEEEQRHREVSLIDVNYFGRLATTILAGPECGRGCADPAAC